MEWVTCLESALQELACLGLGRRGVHCGPLGRELRAPLETPVAERLCNVLACPLVAEILEQPPAYDLADLGLVVGDEVLGHATYDFRDLVLPLLIPLRHLHLAARQADHACAVCGAGGGDGKVLNESVERVRHSAVSV